MRKLLSDRTCASCGKTFDVEIDSETGKILTDCFYGGKIRLGIGYSSHKAKIDSNGKIVTKDGLIVWERCHPWYRELKYKLINLKRTLFHQYRDVEYWECSTCLKKVKDKNEKGQNRGRI